MKEKDNTVYTGQIVKRIPKFPDYYASVDGRIWSLKRKGAEGRWLNQITEKCSGYKTVMLYKNDKPHRSRVHRLILEAYTGPCPEGMEACHNNGIPNDNRLENLRWDTRKSNMNDKKKHGTENHVCGEQMNKSHLTESDIKQIRDICKHKVFTKVKVAKLYGISRTTLYDIINGVSWIHI